MILANPSVLTADTKLYSPAEPEGRVFSQGEPWPGDAWSDKPGGEPSGAAAAKAALGDLATATAKLEQMGRMRVAKDHDLGVMSGERDAANLRVEGLEQRALEAEKTALAADDAAKGYMQERDTAREALKKATDGLADLRRDLETAQAEAAKVEGLTAQLSTAKQTIADLNDKVTDLTAAAAKPPKPTKAAKAASEAPSEQERATAPEADAASAPEAT